MFLKKSILLTNKSDNSNPYALLTIDNRQGKEIYCTLKSYNMKEDEYILGLGIDDNIIKQNIFFHNSNIYNFKLSSKTLDSNTNINSVLVKKDFDDIKPIVWNSDTTHKSKIINMIIDSTTKTITKTKSIDEEIKLFDEDENIEKVIDENLKDISSDIIDKDESSTSECIDNTTTTSSLNHKIVDKVSSTDTTNDNSQEPSFYMQIKDQLEDLFARYEREPVLSKIIPNSEWVRVNYEGQDKHYVVGLIYEEGNIKYICFGVPGSMDKEPQDDLKNYSQWLPTDVNNPTENGYWVMYQDSKNGENIVL